MLSLANRNGLEPLLFQHLHESGPEAVPADAAKTLRENSKVIGARNLILASRLCGISAHLRSRQIEHMAYKGPLLAEDYYGNSALRPFRDLDILVRPHQGLKRRGTHSGRSALSTSMGLRASCRRCRSGAGLVPGTSAGGVDLDLHWRVVQDFKSPKLDMAGIWRRVKVAHLFDCEVPTFCPEDLLVALSIHAGKDEWNRLSNFCDIAQVLRAHPRLDWKIVRSHLNDSNTRRMVYVCWHLLHEHWQASIPEEMMAMISADPHVARLAHRIHAEMWPSPKPLETVQSSFAGNWIAPQARTCGIAYAS